MRVLIADDDPVIRHALRVNLGQWGYDVTECPDGRHAWRILSNGVPNPHVPGMPRVGPPPPPIAIVDWNMPGMDGPTLCAGIRATSGLLTTYVILLTSNASRQHVLAGLQSGADDYLVKPCDWHKLRARLRIATRTVTLQQMLATRVDELQAALDNVRRLSGLLPMCAYCKRIRDDGDYWQQVEDYVCTHADVEFTHGICPDCLTTQVGAAG